MFLLCEFPYRMLLAEVWWLTCTGISILLLPFHTLKSCVVYFFLLHTLSLLLSLRCSECDTLCNVFFWLRRQLSITVGPRDATASEMERRGRCGRRGRKTDWIDFPLTFVIWAPVVCKGCVYVAESYFRYGKIQYVSSLTHSYRKSLWSWEGPFLFLYVLFWSASHCSESLEIIWWGEEQLFCCFFKCIMWGEWMS